MFNKTKNNNSTDTNVLNVINLIRNLEESRGFDPLEVYTKGDCGNLFFLLKEKFPQAIPYIHYKANGKHVITCIDGFFYDIRGKYLVSDIDDTLLRTADLKGLKELSYNFNTSKLMMCLTNNQKLKYHVRESVPVKIAIKTRLKVLSDDIKQSGLSLKDIPVYFGDITGHKHKSHLLTVIEARRNSKKQNTL